MHRVAKTSQLAEIDGRTIELTNLDKLLWPDDGVTKADYIHYVYMVSHLLLPQLKDRPLTVTRYPDGIDREGFYQKDCPGYAPEWVQTYPVPSSDTGKVTRYIVPRHPADLVWLANQAAIEFHPWMSRIQSPDNPDYSVIDLDPSAGATVDDVRIVARAVKEVLDYLGLVAFPKLSGATGIHIYVPLEPKYSYATSAALAGTIGRIVADALPRVATTERLVRNRGQRVYIDHLQNLPGKTIVAAYSVRPRPKAPVSLPVDWSELDAWAPDQYTVKDLHRILQRPASIFELDAHRQNIDALLPLLEVT